MLDFLKPTPDSLSAKAVWSAAPWLFTVLSIVLFALCLVVFTRFWRRGRDATGLLLTLGALGAGLIGEPLMDLLCHVWWPHNLPGPILTTFGIHVPVLIPPIYGFYLGGGGYLAYRAMTNGATVRRLLKLWTAFIAVDAAFQFGGGLLKVCIRSTGGSR